MKSHAAFVGCMAFLLADCLALKARVAGRF
jgi:hypothetical protein